MKTLVFLSLSLSMAGAVGCAQEVDSQEKNQAAPAGRIVTQSSPATVRISQPTGAIDIDQSSLEVTVRAAKISKDEAFIVVVYEQNEAGAEQLGSFSFSHSPREGDVKNFLIAAPTGLANHDTMLKFQLVSADPARGLAATEIEILDTKLLYASNP